VDELRLGVIAHTAKENERRLPIHPRHVERIDADLRARIVLEEGYGASFGVPDQELADLVAGLLPRSELIATSDVVLLPNRWRRTSRSCVRARCCGGGRTACRTGN
jgi:alanine dehydrogenase